MLQINETVSEMDELTTDTEQQLIRARQMLAVTAAFNGTVNLTSVNELVQQIAFYNSTIASLVASAQKLFSELVSNQAQAETIWADIDAEEVMIQALLTNSSIAEVDIDGVRELASQLDTEREYLRTNLSDLSLSATDLLTELADLSISVVNASRDSSEAYASVQELLSNLTMLRSQTGNVLNIALQLNTSIATTRTASRHLVENTNALVVCYSSIERSLCTFLLYSYIRMTAVYTQSVQCMNSSELFCPLFLCI